MTGGSSRSASPLCFTLSMSEAHSVCMPAEHAHSSAVCAGGKRTTMTVDWQALHSRVQMSISESAHRSAVCLVQGGASLLVQ